MKSTIGAIVFFLAIMFLLQTTQAAEPTEAEMEAFQAATAIYEQNTGFAPPTEQIDPAAPPKTPEELAQETATAFQAFIADFPESELRDAAQHRIGWVWFEAGDLEQAKTEFAKLAVDYPNSTLADDAKYQIAFIDYTSNNLETALKGFQDFIAEYEGNPVLELNHKVPFAYFMVGECYRKMNDMEKARVKFQEMIDKYPKHSQNKLAMKRIKP